MKDVYRPLMLIPAAAAFAVFIASGGTGEKKRHAANGTRIVRTASNGEPDLKHIRNSLYEISIGDLMDNPDWFSRAYLFVFDHSHTGSVPNQAAYKVEVRFSLDANDLLRPRILVDFPGRLIGGAAEKQMDTAANWKKYIEWRKEGLDAIRPGLSNELLDILSQYESWEAEGMGFRAVNYDDFRPDNRERVANETDFHFRQTVESDPYPGLFFTDQEREEAEAYLSKKTREMGLVLERLSVRETLDFLDAVFRPFGYVEEDSYDPQGFNDFVKKKEGNCNTYAHTFARSFNLMKENNPKLANTHCIPVHVNRYEGGRHIGHAVNAVFQTDTREFALFDLTSDYDVRTLKTYVWK